MEQRRATDNQEPAEQPSPALPPAPDFVPYNPYAAVPSPPTNGNTPNSAYTSPPALPYTPPPTPYVPPPSQSPYAAPPRGQYAGPNLARIPSAPSYTPPPAASNGYAPTPPTNFGGFAPAASGTYAYATPQKPTVSYGAAASDFRPLNVSETLDRTFALFRRNFALFLTVLGLAYIPYMVLDVIFRIWWLRSVSTDVLTFQTPSAFGTFGSDQYNDVIGSLAHFYGTLAVYVLLLAVINIFQQVAAAALIYAASERYHGREVTMGDAYAHVGGRIGALISWIVLVYLLFLAAGLSLVFLVGVVVVPILAPFFFVSLPVLILERRGGWEALSRSRQLVSRGFWGMSIGLWLLILLLGWLLGQGVGTIITLFVGSLPGLSASTTTAINIALDGLLTFVLSPIGIIAFTIFFINLKIRLEAYDIEAVAGMEAAQ